ncbi:MAG: hypothetical protein ACR2Q4_03045 [Geminicoccaceae bacterium]
MTDIGLRAGATGAASLGACDAMWIVSHDPASSIELNGTASENCLFELAARPLNARFHA